MEPMVREYKLTVTILVPSPTKPEYEKDFDTLFGRLKQEFMSICRNMDNGQGRLSVRIERAA